jgi:hypothetical protein
VRLNREEITGAVGNGIVGSFMFCVTGLSDQ